MKWSHPVLILSLTIAIAAEAFAQFGGGGGAMRRGGSGADNRSRPSEPPAELPRMSGNDQIRMQLADVRLALKPTQEQAAYWRSYEEKVLSLLDDLSRCANVPIGGSALVQIESRIDIVRNRLTAMEDVSDAAKQLYAGLTAEQRAIADGLLPGTVPTLYTGNTSAAAPGRGRPPERQRPRE